MKHGRMGLMVMAGSIVAACDPVEGFDGLASNAEPDSAIVTLETDGSLPDQGFAGNGVSGAGETFLTIDGDLTGYRFAYGRIANSNEFRAVAGFAPDSVPGDAITTGAIDYDGTYRLGFVGRSEQQLSGDITLTATFDDRTVTGEADGLVINGTFIGTDLAGTASFGGVTADLDGVVGQERVVGAFAGNTSGAVLAGGIYADAIVP